MSGAKHDLVRHHLITVTSGKNPRRDSDRISIQDIWPENMNEFCVPIENTGHTDNIVDGAEEYGVSVPIGNTQDTQCSNRELQCSNRELGVPVVAQKKISLRRSQEEDPPIVPPGDTRLSTLDPISTKPRRKKPGTPTPETQEVLNYLNTVHGRQFEDTTEIQSLLNKGKSIADCKRLIDWLWAIDRLENPEGYEKYANNVSPFRPKNFDRLSDRARRWDEQGRPPHASRGARASPDPNGFISQKGYRTAQNSQRIMEDIAHARERQPDIFRASDRNE